MPLSNQRILITGATGGIGQALARQFAEAGVALLLSGHNAARLTQLRNTLPKSASVAIVAADLSQTKELDKVACKAKRFGVSGLVNLCGVNDFARVTDQDDAEIELMLALNLRAPIQLVRRLLPSLRAQPEAFIVNVGSTFGSIGHAGYAGYCATKFGLRGFTEALRRELSDTSIAVQYIAPRATATLMNDETANRLNKMLGNRVDSPEIVASKIAEAIAKRRASTHLGWPEKFFASLNQMAPWLVDRGMRRNTSAVFYCLDDRFHSNQGNQHEESATVVNSGDPAAHINRFTNNGIATTDGTATLGRGNVSGGAR